MVAVSCVLMIYDQILSGVQKAPLIEHGHHVHHGIVVTEEDVNWNAKNLLRKAVN